MRFRPYGATLLLLALAGCRTTGPEANSSLLANGNAVGEFKGIEAIEAFMESRMLDSGQVRLDAFMRAPNTFTNTQPMRELLGVFAQANGATTFKNGTPNSLNVALWQSTFRRVAEAISSKCAADTEATFPGQFGDTAPMKASFVQKFRKVCAWPAPEAQTEEAMMGLWTAVMAFQAPKAEFLAWRDWFLNQPAYKDKPGPEVVQDMLVAIMMNPHFLLTQ